jgi:hypothetical protein
MTAAVTERPAWMQGVEIRYGADGEILNAEEIVTAVAAASSSRMMFPLATGRS